MRREGTFALRPAFRELGRVKEKTMEYSVIIPVYNEEGSLGVLHEELTRVMDALRSPYEIIYVDDSSDDASPQTLNAFRSQRPDSVRIVRMERRSGQTSALSAGMRDARGKVFITLDADLQNDPEDIPFLLAKMNEGNDVVCGWRRDRRDPWLKKILSKTGNVLQRLLTGLAVHDISCTLRAYRRKCLEDVDLEWEGQHRFIPLILARQGYKVGEVASHHRARRYGYSKYTHKRIFRVVNDFFRILRIPAKKIKGGT